MKFKNVYPTHLNIPPKVIDQLYIPYNNEDLLIIYFLGDDVLKNLDLFPATFRFIEPYVEE